MTATDPVTRHHPTARTRRPVTTDVLRAGATAALAAATANVALFAIGRASDAAFLVTGRGGDATSVTLIHVLVSTLLPIAFATGLAALVAGRSPRRLRALVLGGIVVAVASAIAPLAFGLDTATRLLLAAMHLVAGLSFATALWPQRHRDA